MPTSRAFESVSLTQVSKFSSVVELRTVTVQRFINALSLLGMDTKR